MGFYHIASFLPTLPVKTISTTSTVAINRTRIIHKSLNLDDINWINGLDVGIPLNLISNIFTNLHYGYDITTSKLLLLQFLIGYYSYGKDRYKDALEYEETQMATSKEKLYKSLLQYRHLTRFSYCVAFYGIAFILYENHDPLHTIPILTLLYSTEYYKDLKIQAAFLKPFYVSFMWTFATIIMPCVLYEHNYNILNDPYDYLPCMLILFASTNYADIMDIEEDTKNGIKTFPVTFGEEKTKKIIFASLAISSMLFGLHPHYMDRPIINSLFELQNAVLSSIIMFKTQNNRH
jgi:hypothetical protein